MFWRAYVDTRLRLRSLCQRPSCFEAVHAHENGTRLRPLISYFWAFLSSFEARKTCLEMSLIQPMHENLGKRLGLDCSECMVVWELGYVHNQQLTIGCMVTRLAGCVLIM